MEETFTPAVGQITHVDQWDGTKWVDRVLVWDGSRFVDPPADDEILSDDEPVFTCPYCGDEGGEPMSIPSREFQGCYGHGGYVDFEEHCCSNCFRGLLR